MKSDNQATDIARIIDLLESLVKMKVSETLKDELKDSQKRKLYELTGTKNVKQISELTGLATGTISGQWKKWHSMGLITKKGKFYFKLTGEDDADE